MGAFSATAGASSGTGAIAAMKIWSGRARDVFFGVKVSISSEMKLRFTNKGEIYNFGGKITTAQNEKNTQKFWTLSSPQLRAAP